MAGKKGQGTLPKKIIEKLKDLFLEGGMTPYRASLILNIDNKTASKYFREFADEQRELAPLGNNSLNIDTLVKQEVARQLQSNITSAKLYEDPADLNTLVTGERPSSFSEREQLAANLN